MLTGFFWVREKEERLDDCYGLLLRTLAAVICVLVKYSLSLESVRNFFPWSWGEPDEKTRPFEEFFGSVFQTV